MAAEKVICDTDVIIDLWKEANPRHKSTKSIIEGRIGYENIVLSTVTKIELLVGAVDKADMLKISKNIAPLIISPIDTNISLMAVALIEKYFLSHNLAFADSFIAATAIESDLELFTYNKKDYKFISELKLYKH